MFTVHSLPGIQILRGGSNLSLGEASTHHGSKRAPKQNAGFIDERPRVASAVSLNLCGRSGGGGGRAVGVAAGEAVPVVASAYQWTREGQQRDGALNVGKALGGVCACLYWLVPLSSPPHSPSWPHLVSLSGATSMAAHRSRSLRLSDDSTPNCRSGRRAAGVKDPGGHGRGAYTGPGTGWSQSPSHQCLHGSKATALYWQPAHTHAKFSTRNPIAAGN